MIALLLYRLVLVGLLAFLIWRVTRRTGLDPQSPDAAMAGVLPPDESRWYVGPLAGGAIVSHSYVHYELTGFRVGEAQGQAIWVWAKPGTEAEAKYLAAYETREPQTFFERHTAPDGSPHISKVVIVPAADGGLYCESRDVSAAVLPRDAEIERLRQENARLQADLKAADQAARAAGSVLAERNANRLRHATTDAP